MKGKPQKLPFRIQFSLLTMVTWTSVLAAIAALMTLDRTALWVHVAAGVVCALLLEYAAATWYREAKCNARNDKRKLFVGSHEFHGSRVLGVSRTTIWGLIMFVPGFTYITCGYQRLDAAPYLVFLPVAAGAVVGGLLYCTPRGAITFDVGEGTICGEIGYLSLFRGSIQGFITDFDVLKITSVDLGDAVTHNLFLCSTQSDDTMDLFPYQGLFISMDDKRRVAARIAAYLNYDLKEQP